MFINRQKMTLLKSPSSPLFKYSAGDPASQTVFLDIIKKQCLIFWKILWVAAWHSWKLYFFQKWKNNLDLIIVLLKEMCCLNSLPIKNYQNYSFWSDHKLFISKVVTPMGLKKSIKTYDHKFSMWSHSASKKGQQVLKKH